VGLHEIAVVEIFGIRALGTLGAVPDHVPFALVVDAVGESPIVEAAPTVETPIGGVLVEVEFADAADVVAAGAEPLVEGGEVEGIILEIVLDAGAAVGAGGGEAGAGGAQRGELTMAC
jgi:hypothetical protein